MNWHEIDGDLDLTVEDNFTYRIGEVGILKRINLLNEVEDLILRPISQG